MYEERQFFVYMTTDKNNRVIYTGMTNNLACRAWDHKSKMIKGFTSRYNVTKLVYYEIYATAYDAIAREKQIKAGSRQKKIDLINKVNSKWKNLYQDGEILPLD